MDLGLGERTSTESDWTGVFKAPSKGVWLRNLTEALAEGPPNKVASAWRHPRAWLAGRPESLSAVSPETAMPWLGTKLGVGRAAPPRPAGKTSEKEP